MDYLVVFAVGLVAGYTVGRWGLVALSDRVADAWHWVRSKFSNR